MRQADTQSDFRQHCGAAFKTGSPVYVLEEFVGTGTVIHATAVLVTKHADVVTAQPDGQLREESIYNGGGHLYTRTSKKFDIGKLSPNTVLTHDRLRANFIYARDNGLRYVAVIEQLSVGDGTVSHVQRAVKTNDAEAIVRLLREKTLRPGVMQGGLKYIFDTTAGDFKAQAAMAPDVMARAVLTGDARAAYERYVAERVQQQVPAKSNPLAKLFKPKR